MTIHAFRYCRGLVGGLALTIAAALGAVGLSGCGAPAYNYVADSPQHTYYKVPSSWHVLSDSATNAELSSLGQYGPGMWTKAFDATGSPSAQHFLDFTLTKPFILSEVIPLSADASAGLSYNTLRDILFPVTATARQNALASGTFPLTQFTQIRDATITAKNGVHGVRETFSYDLGSTSDTFDEEALTNANQTVVYALILHCTSKCYSQNTPDINTVMSSFTVGSSS